MKSVNIKLLGVLTLTSLGICAAHSNNDIFNDGFDFMTLFDKNTN